jgi:hypothetical protein
MDWLTVKRRRFRSKSAGKVDMVDGKTEEGLSSGKMERHREASAELG